MGEDLEMKNFGHPVVWLALKKALVEAYQDCTDLAQWNLKNELTVAYEGASDAREALGKAMARCEELLREQRKCWGQST